MDGAGKILIENDVGGMEVCEKRWLRLYSDQGNMRNKAPDPSNFPRKNSEYRCSRYMNDSGLKYLILEGVNYAAEERDKCQYEA